MKKNVLLLAIAALTVSCSNEEIMEPMAQLPIGFSAATTHAAMMRSTLTDGNTLKNNSFEVYAFNAKDGNLFLGRKLKGQSDALDFSQGVEIAYQDNAWNYKKPEEKAYWPVDALNFYAFHPLSDPSMGYTVEVQSDQKQQLKYSVPTNPKGEKDILYAVAKKVTKDTNEGKVKLTFKHALSLITFKAKTELASMTVDIEDWKIHVISHNGTMTLPEDEAGTPTWLVGKKTPIDNENLMTKNMEKPIDGIGHSEAQSLGSKLYIPQTLKAWDTKKTINDVDVMAKEDSQTPDELKETYLSILCRIRQNGNLLWGKEGEYRRLYVPFGDTWEPGKRYVYTLVFGGGYDEYGKSVLKPLEIEADVEDMEDALQDVETSVGLGKQN